MILGLGAEALVELKDGRVVKRRLEKKYRHPLIDEKLRKSRTKKEARILQKLKGVVNVPEVISVKPFELEMTYIEGVKLRDRSIKGLEKQLGHLIGALHSRGIAHNDLTTSNILFDRSHLWLIDFGLADYGKIEDFATDLKVFLDGIKIDCEDFDVQLFFEAYSQKMPASNEVCSRLEKVYSRGRYKSK